MTVKRTLAPELAAAGLALLSAGIVLEIWKATWSAPFAYERDAVQNLVMIKNTLEQGWPLTNPGLGAPFGSQLYDFPVVAGDSLHLALLHAIGLFSSNPALVANVFFVAMFPLTAAVTTWVLGRLGLSAPVAAVCGVLYALAPYHFVRGEVHLFLQGYYGVPLGAYIAMTALMGESLRRRHRPWALALMCVVVATTDVYFAAFCLILIATAAAVAAFDPARRIAARQAALAGALILAIVAVQHAPSVAYELRHGSNEAAAALRWPAQSEVFGMKVVRLVLPVDDHRLAPLRRVTADYDRAAPPQLIEGPAQALGIAGTVGFLFLLGFGLLRLVSGGGRFAGDERLRAASLLTITATLVAVTGGFSLVVAYLVSDSIRSWDRMSIVIAFFAILAVGVLLDAVAARLRARATPRWALGALAAVVLTVAALDQAPANVVPQYDRIAADWRSEDAFFSALESRLPPDAMVYEAPYVPFPERGYDEARPYLHSHSLRWSFGAMEGRPADWGASLVGQPGNVVIPAVAAAGFSGVLVNRSLYADGGAAASADLTAYTGSQPLVDPNGLYAFFDLRPFAAGLRAALGPADTQRLARAVLHPVRIAYGREFSTPLPQGGPLVAGSQRRTDRPFGRFEFRNPGPGPRRITYSAEVGTAKPGSAALTVEWPNGTQTIPIDEKGAPLQRTLTLPPGTTRVRLRSNQPLLDGLRDYIGLQSVSIADAELVQLAARAPRHT